MVRLIEKRLPASTLMEVLIAMVIIMIVFVISIQVFNNVLSSGVSFKKLQVQNQLNVLSQEVKQQGYAPEHPQVIDSVTYEYQVENGETGLSQLEIKASEQGKLIGNVKCLFKNQERSIAY